MRAAMDLPKQKNFYDVRRQFQGRDQPTDAHPDSTVREPFPIGHVIFGLIFLAAIAGLAFMSVKSAREELVPTTVAAPATPSAPPAAKK
jgi:hypothetical protein